MQDKKSTATNDTTDILHHIGLINSNLGTLAACYQRLGFTLTPVSIPKVIIRPDTAPETLGVGNRHAIFSDNYLELLGVVDAPRWTTITKEQRGPYDIDAPLSRLIHDNGAMALTEIIVCTENPQVYASK